MGGTMIKYSNIRPPLLGSNRARVTKDATRALWCCERLWSLPLVFYFLFSTTIIIGARCSTKLDWCPVSAPGCNARRLHRKTARGSHSCEEPRAHRSAFLGSFEAAAGNMFHRRGSEWQHRVRQKLQIILKATSHNHLDWLQQSISIL